MIPADHRVRMLNWSRTSRLFGLLWYIVLPFTLINVAGHMAPKLPPKRGPEDLTADSAPRGQTSPLGRSAIRAVRWLLGFTVGLVGMAMTAAAIVWAVAIGETLFRFVELSKQGWVGKAILAVVGVSLIIATVTHWVRGARLIRMHSEEEAEGSVDYSTTWLHITSTLSLVTIVATTIALWLYPPSLINLGQRILYLSVPTPPAGARSASADDSTIMTARFCADAAQGDFSGWEHRLDPLTAVVAGSFAVAILVSTIFIIIGAFPRSKSIRPQLSGAALVITLALVLLNVIGASVRLGAHWLMMLLDDIGSLGWITPNALPLDGRQILVFLGRRIESCKTDPVGFWYNGTFLVDAMPLITALGIVAFVASAWLVCNRYVSELQGRSIARGAELRLKFAHRVVASLGDHLGLIMTISAVIWALLVAIVWYTVEIHDGPSSALMSDVVRIVSNGVAIAAVAFILLGGRMFSVRKFFATVADIAGFWDRRFHPLSGATYRYKVTVGLRKEIELHRGRRVVLVGHSQGSVLCAWFLASKAKLPPAKLSLVTCGSPLATLYATFFPSYVNAETYAQIVDRTDRRWVNVWRRTDPIASKIVAPGVDGPENYRLPDPHDRSRKSALNAHSEYWSDPDVMAIVDALGQDHLARGIQTPTVARHARRDARRGSEASATEAPASDTQP